EDHLVELDETEFGNVIVVDQLPVVGMDRFEKLEGAIRKLYNQLGVVIKEDGFSMPVDSDTNTTNGYCFIEFNTPQEAQKAKEKTHGCKFGKSHILAVYMFDDIERLMNVKEEWEPPQIKPYAPNVNLQKWLTDEKARDQFVIRCGSDTEVLWNDTRHLKSESVHTLQNWTESFVQWSPLGSYLVTLHKPGVAFCGGASTFKPLMHYKHPMVELVDVSPGENYLVTYQNQKPNNPQDSNASQAEIKIFNVRSGRLMRCFMGSADEFSVGGSSVSWPVFKWAGGRDDKYFARLRKNTVSVYETETFSLIGKKSMKVDNVVDISWSPTDSILALFVPEQVDGNQPARVALIQLPSKVEIRQKNLFNVSGCKMYWQSNGDYLAVKVDRYSSKSKKSTHSGFEIFRVKEKDIPIEVLELDNKNDQIIDFAWEPNGHRFAVIHGELPRPDVSFYSMRTTQHTGRVSKLVTLKSKQANALFWSPTGKYIILADGLSGFNGKLEFYNVDELVTMATVENFMATDIEWDPTGRYVATAVTSSVHEMENGFYIWSFCGKLLYQTLKEQLFQFSWRPRPPSLLSNQKEEEVEKNLKQYLERYEEEDGDVSVLLRKQEKEKRRMMIEEWEIWLNKWKKLNEEEKIQRQNLIGDEEEEEFYYETIEELIDVSEEVIPFEL
ncbi:hypothetical protein EUTSA_v10027018mg, partial [Eutrema salsugineum]